MVFDRKLPQTENQGDSGLDEQLSQKNLWWQNSCTDADAGICFSNHDYEVLQSLSKGGFMKNGHFTLQETSSTWKIGRENGRSIFPSRASFLILLKPVRFVVCVPDMPSSVAVSNLIQHNGAEQNF